LAYVIERLLQPSLLVFLGGGFGSVLRFLVGRLSLRLLGEAFPFGTLAINVTGSFAMGIVIGWFAFRGQADQNVRLFLTTGIIGGFTTYSTFALESALLWERGDMNGAILYLLGTVALGLVAIFGGLGISRVLLQHI
jgi:CrcB protein